MKKILSYGLFLMIVLFSACRKSDNPKIPTLQRVPVPALSVTAGTSATIIPSDIANYVGKVTVDVFFKTDVPPKKMDLVIFKNNDTAGQKILHPDITTYPSVISFTGPQLVTLFGTIKTCDFFSIGVNITTADGTLYEAFPKPLFINGKAINIVPYGSGIAGEYGGVLTSLAYSTKVEYDPTIYSGNFIPVSDEFGDFLPTDITLFTTIDATHFSFKSPQAFNALPIIVSVDPATLVASITKQKIGDYFLWEHGYTNPNVSASGTATNKVSPCDKTLTLTLNYTVDQGSFGGYKIVFIKQ